MNKVRLLAACAAVTLAAAACGDDDDDASGDSALASNAVATAAESPTASAGGEIDPEVAEDCQALVSALSEVTEDGPADPAVGEEISDEYKDAVQSLVDAINEVDLQSEEVQSAVDQQLDVAEDILDADEWTEELQTATQDATTPLTEVCAPALATGSTTD
jgi:hypothetical protein